MKIRLLKTIIISLLVLPVAALAQVDVNIPYALENELNVEVLPTYPKPSQVVFVNLTMYTADLDSADIAWYKDGKQVLLGKGLKEYSYIAGKAGEETDIEIRIRLQNGSVFSKSFSINPAGVDILWEADSYVPPFYKGKALHPRQGRLKLVAMPDFVKNGSKVDSNKLIYEWSNGLEVLQSQSGYGRSVVVINGALLGSTENIELLVRDPINNLTAQAFVDIPTSNPELVFYKNDPYYGYIFDSALVGNLQLLEDEIQVFASPYFFTRESGGGLQYSWRLNSRAAQELDNSRTAVFRRPEGESGQSVIKLDVSNLNRILQFADDNLTIKFDEKN